jgi:hypothetical protein
MTTYLPRVRHSMRRRFSNCFVLAVSSLACASVDERQIHRTRPPRPIFRRKRSVSAPLLGDLDMARMTLAFRETKNADDVPVALPTPIKTRFGNPRKQFAVSCRLSEQRGSPTHFAGTAESARRLAQAELVSRDNLHEYAVSA